MIYTITFSPALDYILELDEFKVGEINRAKKEKVLPGGKGINVSIVLNNLGVSSLASGFIAGFVGNYINDNLKERGILTDFVEVEGLTRINVKIEKPVETAINAIGPNITSSDVDNLFNKINKCQKGDIVAICGAIPVQVKNEQYYSLLENLNNRGVDFIVDTTKEHLLNSLKYHPLLIKPNKEELEELFNCTINSDEELILYSTKLINQGARNVIVSLGGNGALLIGQNIKPIRAYSPKGKVINTVGAGDSLVAGFIAEYTKSKDIEKAFYIGMSAGSASAFSENLATEAEVKEIYQFYGGK